MKSIRKLLWLWGCCFSLASIHAAETNEVQYLWAAPTNRWPATVWVYKTVPQSFAPVVLSNLMAICEFTRADITNFEDLPPLEDVRLYFKKSDGREAGYLPPYGLIHYNNYKAEAGVHEVITNVSNPTFDDRTNYWVHEIATNVPSKEEVFQLGLEYLQKLGIDRSQLAVKEDGWELRTARDEGREGWFDQARGTNFTQVISRGVFFIRRINGIDFDGITHGGAYFRFGNYGQLISMEVLWKGFEPYTLHRTMNSEDYLRYIKAGRGKWQWPPESPPLPDVKTVTITKITPLYQGLMEDEEDVKGTPRYLEPYAQLEGVMDNGVTNQPVVITCPILQDRQELPRR